MRPNALLLTPLLVLALAGCATAGGERIATYRLVFNGFLADVATEAIPALAAMPGVAGVWPAPMVQSPIRARTGPTPSWSSTRQGWGNPAFSG